MEPERRVKLMQGNEACAEGAIAAGVRFYAGYPITPSNEIANIMSARLPQVGGKFIQMEDEIASLAAAIGAALTGVKAMDATSGPGFSLKMENLGLACMVEVPLVLVNVQRVGPSIGMATSPAQGDVMQARYGSHGDYATIVLSPSSVQDMFDFTIKAVDLSERFRVPVILLADQVVGHMRQNVTLPPYDTIKTAYRSEPQGPVDQYHPYKGNEKGVPPMAKFGSPYHWYANSSAHNEDSFQATSDFAVSKALVERLTNKIEKNKHEIIEVRGEFLDDAEIVVLAFGCTAIAARGAVLKARDSGIKAGFFRPLVLWPFPEDEVRVVSEKAKAIIVPEMNMGQYVHPVREAACRGKAEVFSLARLGEVFSSSEILRKIVEVQNVV
ncbi:MAG: 2-oxoglutarate oxidoreductase subunit KorA [Syntrophorhabdaceae bacterium PtaU1.Bin034]|jgi:2-oxoglutarate ferredoxin oxidoreductase subunit alpha|nr:MAG: 2-oxoglutarate oxidoreductase subunit KorA [Syntrophorhabdaceae bacterium PtaU1.Bin034]